LPSYIITNIPMKLKNLLLVFFIVNFFNTYIYANEEKLNAVTDQIQIISEDLKTLEKAVYKKADITSGSFSSSNNLNEDVLTKHLLKLNEIEDQFRD